MSLKRKIKALEKKVLLLEERVAFQQAKGRIEKNALTLAARKALSPEVKESIKQAVYAIRAVVLNTEAEILEMLKS